MFSVQKLQQTLPRLYGWLPRMLSPGRARLGRRVGTHRIQQMIFIHRLAQRRAVNFRRGDMNKTFYRMVDNCIGNDLGSNDIRLEEQRVVINRPGDMRFGGKVYDHVAFGNQFIDDVRVSDVPMKKTKVAVPLQGIVNIIQVSRVSQGIQKEDSIGRVLSIQVIDEVTADKPGPAGNQKIFFGWAHFLLPFLSEAWSREFPSPPPTIISSTHKGSLSFRKKQG